MAATQRSEPSGTQPISPAFFAASDRITAARSTAWKGILLALATAAAIGVVAGQFLAIHPARYPTAPIATDTLKYIWRTNLASSEGVRQLTDVPAGTSVNADRPAFPVIASLLHAATGTDPYRLSFVVPAACAVLIGIAGAAFARAVLREPAWSFPLYILAVGGSVNVALIATGYFDTLLMAIVALATMTCAVLAAEGMATAGGAAVLLAGAAIVHWGFAALTAALLVALGVILLPGSWRDHRRGASAWATPTGRLASIVAGGAIGAGLLFVLAPSGPQPPLTSRSSQRRKLSLFMPLHRLEISAPLAALGAASLARGRVRGRLYGLALLLAWTATAVAGIFALWAGSTVPAHRLLAFCLAIPMLGAALAVALLRASRRLGPVAVAAGVAVVLSGLAGQAFITHARWFDLARPAMAGPTFDRYPAALSEALAQAATAGEYVERYAGDRGVVYVVPSLRYQGIEPGRVALSAIRAAVPPDQITRTAVYIGAPARLLAGRPTFLPGARRFNFASRRFWEGARALQDPLVIRLEAFTPTDPNVSLAPIGAEVAPGVHVVSGPVVREVGLAPGPSPPSTTGLIVLTSLVVLFLAVTGAGWAAALARGSFWQWIFLSPAFGITTLACFGLIADAAGLSLDRAGLPIVLSATLLGWLVFGVRLRVGRLSVSGDPEIAPGPDRFR